ncbi:LOW QUALITY PROTEIN: uncharacterized protein [Amphiura filiformis]|uniref:LOW QUALITY PROTEIN: uncharacterized protein n=1 Tax=Amphiura filiformis TaxID=82378 RepID=UPI003B225F00
MSASSRGRNKQNSATLNPERTAHTRNASTGSSTLVKTSNHDNAGGGRATSGSTSARTEKHLQEPSKDTRPKSADGAILSESSDDRTKRLLFLSNKIKNVSPVTNSLLPHVKLVQYKYESGSFESMLNQIEQALKSGGRVDSIACILHTKPGSVLMFTNGNGEHKEILTPSNIAEQTDFKNFIQTLENKYLNKSSANCRIDFLACKGLRHTEISNFEPVLKSMVDVPFGISKDILGSDINLPKNETLPYGCVGEMYFKVDKLKNWSPQPQTLAGFERIRTVGKGAYGAAVLYRKKDDDSLVILKEINMHDLTANERQMALNEIRVLGMLDHPNIISYYDSFEEDGTLMIEMEYADGGTLAQYLNSIQGKRELQEREILVMFQQMVAAIRHIHEHKILHRDLKTANIFLTKEGIIKIGDFGISKVMSSHNQGANTVLGTPYYISPEICEGKPYNSKSDIWALGCILYEMACLQKTFEGTNLPALVNKIMKGQFTPVKGNYSQEFKTLVQDMLQREPEYRPSAKELLFARLPIMMNRFEDPITDFEDDLQNSTDSVANRKQRMRSVLYLFDNSTLDMTPIELPAKIKIRQVAVSSTHTIVVTFERDVFTWGEGKLGGLGHGDLNDRYHPEVVEALKGKSITKVCSGDGFSVFGSDNGIVMTCGDGSNGCLGHGDWCHASRPRLIETLLSVDVTSISCGPQHVVAIGHDGEVFAWGNGKDGRLGLSDEEKYCEPKEVELADPVFIQQVKCGMDGTMFLTDMGCLLACGNNENNKLGLNNRQGFLMAMKNIFTKTEVEGRKVPTVIKTLSTFRVLDMVLGPHHSAIIVDPGVIYTFGRNVEGQLGMGNTKPREAPAQVRNLSDKRVTMVACGNSYTVSGTEDNALYMWGKGPQHTPPPSDEGTKNSTDMSNLEVPQNKRDRHHSTGSLGSTSSLTPAGEKVSRDASPAPSLSSESSIPSVPTSANPTHRTANIPKSAPPGVTRERHGSSDSNVFASSGEKLLSPTPSAGEPRTSGGSATRRPVPSASSMTSMDGNTDKSELLLQPTPILMLGSMENEGCGDAKEAYQLSLTGVICQGDMLYIQVETSCPLPRRKQKRKKRTLGRRTSNQSIQMPSDPQVPKSAQSNDAGDEYTSSETSELDTLGTEGGGCRSNQCIQMPSDSQAPKSAQSNDAGDEYTSSETSELDTLGTIPTWIKKELKDSKPGDEENDADDSDDDALIEEMAAPNVATPGIKISKELSALKGVKGDKQNGFNRQSKSTNQKSDNIYDTKKADSKISGSQESGIELIQSSDSSTAEHNLFNGKTSSAPDSPRTKKPTNGQPTMSQVNKTNIYKHPKPAGPGTQRPIARFRAVRGRGGGRTSSWTIEGSIKETKKPDPKARDENLRMEVVRLQEERQQTLEQLQMVEEEQRKHHEVMELAAKKAVEDKEKALKAEIDLLREELVSQSRKMADNNQMMQQMHEQLVRLESRDTRSRDRAKTEAVGSSTQSKVCTLS